MTTTITATQTASVSSGTVTTPAILAVLSAGTERAALVRFQISANLYFTYPLYLNLVFGGTPSGSTETYKILVSEDWNQFPTLASGALSPTTVPEPAYSLGTGPYYEVGTVSMTSYGTKAIEIDLAVLGQRVLTKSQDYTDPWAGSLVFWVIAEQTNALAVLSFSALNTPTLSAYTTIDYANRDTGTRGINSSRWDRCPVSGLKVPHGEMVQDGYRNILVRSDSYDPPEPEPMEWDDRPDDNEVI